MCPHSLLLLVVSLLFRFGLWLTVLSVFQGTSFWFDLFSSGIFLFSVSLISAFTFIISFLLSALGQICSSFSFAGCRILGWQVFFFQHAKGDPMCSFGLESFS